MSEANGWGRERARRGNKAVILKRGDSGVSES